MLVLLVGLGCFSVSAPMKVRAVTGQETDPIIKYCQDLLKGKKNKAELEKACLREDNLRRARNVASYHCDVDASQEKKADCVDSKAKSYFKAAINSKPKNADALTQALEKQLKKVGGNPDKPEDGFNGAVKEATGGTQNGDSVKGCQPNDGLCAVCSSNHPKEGCVPCDKNNCADPALKCTKESCDLIKKYVNPAVNLMSLIFGLIAAASLAMGAVAFASSEGDPQKTAKAKDRIAKTIFAVVAYMFLYAFLQFIIPGGAFNR